MNLINDNNVNLPVGLSLSTSTSLSVHSIILDSRLSSADESGFEQAVEGAWIKARDDNVGADGYYNSQHLYAKASLQAVYKVTNLRSLSIYRYEPQSSQSGTTVVHIC